MNNNHLKLLNIGCGFHWHPDWVNIDLTPPGPEVTKFDLRDGLPFPDETFDAVYHSHVLEHLEPQRGKELLVDCHRVLKPGGVLRVVVPDLEYICRAYLEVLDRYSPTDPDHEIDHEWMVLEVIDQHVRTRSGGEMIPFLVEQRGRVTPFLRSYMNQDLLSFLEDRSEPSESRSFSERIAGKSIGYLAKRASFLVLDAIRKYPSKLMLTLIGGRKYVRAFENAMFREEGEIHNWMYDHVSLTKALLETGLVETKKMTADTSQIPDFERYQLDTNGDRTRKPHSLFMEARRPLDGT